MLRHLKQLPLISTLVTLCAVVIMFALANWQVNRGLEKAQRLRSIAEATEHQVLSLSQLFTYNAQRQDLPVVIQASIDTRRVLLLDNRIVQGRPGFDVYALAKHHEQNVLVNFGWVAGKQRREDLPDIVLPATLSGAMGRVVQPQSNPLISETASQDGVWPKVIQQIDIAFIESVLHTRIAPFVIALTDNNNSHFIRQWQPVVMQPQKHYAYAIQWLGLGIAALVVYFFALRNRFKKGNS